MRAEDFFHVGIVADDVEATRRTLTSLFGYDWGPEVGGPVAVTIPCGDIEIGLQCAYSTTTPRLEVVRSVPGTLWQPATDAGVHHLGYWSDDVARDVAELTAGGYVTEASRAAPDGSLFFAFLRSDRGFRVEMVSRSAQAGLEQCWAPHDAAS